MEYNKNKKIYV